MPRFRTEEELDALCEQELRKKNAELAQQGQQLRDDYKEEFRSAFKRSYKEAFAKVTLADGRHRR
jgi:hypothetical protein